MKTVIYLLLISISVTADGQVIVFDSTMSKARGIDGYQNTKQEFKQFKAKDIYGNNYSEDSLKGKITFINFWMENCRPCIAEFGSLNGLYEKYKDNKDFRFLSFTYESRENVLRIIDKYHLQYPIICIDMIDLYRLNFSLGFPTNLLTDKTGQIRFIKCGGYNEIEKVKDEFVNIYFKEIEKAILE